MANSIDVCMVNSIDVCMVNYIDVCMVNSIDVRMANSIDVCMANSIDVCMVNSIDVRMVNSIDVRMANSIDVCMANSIDVCMVNSIDVCMANSNDVCMVNSIDVRMVNSIDVRMANSIDVCMANSIDVCMANSIDVCMVNSIDVRMVNSIDVCMVNSIDVCMVNSIDVCMANSIDVCMVNSIDVRMVNSIDVCMVNSIDVCMVNSIDVCMANSLTFGMEYLHKTTLRSHGNLKSSNCVIDSRWVLKITDFGAVVSYKKPHTEGDPGNRAYYSSLLWCAPEILRMSKRPQKGTQKGDVYSFGIILQEILLRCGPYLYNNNDPAEIISLVKSKGHSRPPYRPILPNENDCPAKATSLMVICWSEEPEARPDFHNIRKRLREFNGHKRFNIMDNMLQMLESYSSNLEVLVNERTEELEAEKRKTDTLLYQMLPPLVAEQLKSGMCVIPEYYDHVSIFFSDIVGFTAIASQSKPLEVVDLLNDLYTCFDEVIARRDVYKVETIGDAYMCVSGCPKRNGPRHAGEIANMALDLISAVTHFRIRHKPEETLNLRVGLHTGPCAAGVVGRTMPRYCLFGDTVNMASRMESTGKALHIHMSHEMKEALDDLDWGFLMVDRGFIEVKGKGLHKTFWLVGKKNYKKPLPESLVALQKKLEDGDNPPTPSYCTLTVGDSMFSALRKTSITISNITVENTPYTSDSEEAPGAHHVNAPDAAGRGGESGLRSASAIMSSVPKRRYATVQPANLVISTEEKGEEGRRTKNGRHADSEISDGGDAIGCDSPTLGKIVTADSQDREKYSPVRQPIKKDSACYSLADVNGDHHEANKTSSEITTSRDSVTDLTKLDTDLTVISSDHRSVFGDSELRDSPEDPAATAATNRKRESRKKYWERRAENVGSGEIPRIEIT
ncbi:Nitrogen permease reactivator protein [Bulinus truncatus]|nr:Nitrogen permease reactivator protein [Bulinus truncatus]